MSGPRPAGSALGSLLVAAAATLWGCWALFLRPSGLSGIQCSLVALGIMSLPGPFVLRRRSLTDRGATVALLLVGLADAANMGLYFAALQRGPLAVGVLTHYLAPVAVALTAPALIGEPRSRRALLAAPLSLLGLGLLVWRPGGELPLETALLGAGSAAFYAVVVLGAKKAGRAYSPLAIVSLHAPVSALVLLALSGPGAVPAWGAPALRVALGGALCGLFASALFFAGLGRVSAQVAGALTYLEPLAAAALGFVAFGERIGGPGLLGAGLILACGIWVATEPTEAVALSVQSD